MKALKKIGKYALYTLIISIVSLLIFEWVYRSYLIDFYRSELTYLNPTELSLPKEKTVLIFGDSFSADKDSYVKHLRDSLIEYNVINCALPGTSFKQHALFFKDRVKEFNPDQIIIQLYVGNDLIDYKHPINWSKNSFIRNLYWCASDQFIGLQFINYRFGQYLKPSTKFVSDPKTENFFNPKTYNHRERVYYHANPAILEESILLSKNGTEIAKSIAIDLKEELSYLVIPCSVVVIPHAAQIKEEYANNMQSIGASFNTSTLLEFKSFIFYHFLQQYLSKLPHVTVCTPFIEFKKHKENLYYLNDPHLNNKGQFVLANYLLNNLNY